MQKSKAWVVAVILGAIVGALTTGTVPAARANVLIQEAYPSPHGTATGGEAVLLHNNGETDVDVSGWTLGTDSSATDATIPANTTLAPHALYLIADTGWSTLKDNPAWATASTEQAITLRDSPGTLTLRSQDGGTMDSATYPDPDKGVAYWRYDTDTSALQPNDPQFSAPLDALYFLNLIGVSTSSPAGSGNISVTDNGTPVRAVRPIAGRTHYLSVNVVADQEPTLTFLGETHTMETLGSRRWTADIGLPYDTTPGPHNVSTNVGLSTTLEILPLLAIESDQGTLELGNSSSLTGDTVFGSGGPTIRNAGNVALDVYAARSAILKNGSRTTGNVKLDMGNGLVNVTSESAALGTLDVHESAPLSILASATGGPGNEYATSIALQLRRKE